jgi:hypothetical protein
MREGSAVDPRELLKPLAEQQADLTQLQRLVIEHTLAEVRLEAGVAMLRSSMTLRRQTLSQRRPAFLPLQPYRWHLPGAP